jgi:hypothetical protein
MTGSPSSKRYGPGGGSHAAIVRETGLNWRNVAKWTRLEALPERRTMAPKSTTAERLRTYLARRWAEGYAMGREPPVEIKAFGYAGSLTNLRRFLNRWRQEEFLRVRPESFDGISMTCSVAGARYSWYAANKA